VHVRAATARRDQTARLHWSLTHLQRLLRTWRQAHFAALAGAPLPSVSVLPQTISCVVGAALCIKPRGLLTAPQVEKVDLLKCSSSDFATMRQFVMRFCDILHGRDTDKLDTWLDDARDPGIHCPRQFAVKARQDLAAVRNAVTEHWSTDEIDQLLLSFCANLLRPTSDRAAKSGVRDASPAAQLSQSLLLCGTRRRPRAPFGPGFR
jgi:hypothetical protein